MKKLLIIMFLITLYISSSNAGNIEVDADEALEWHRDKKMYLAKGNATATQDNKSISADTLYAYYEENETSKFDIWKIEGENNVLITSDQNKIIGDYAVYNTKTKVFTVTGKNINILSPKNQIKAKEKVEYFEDKQQVIANKDVIIYHENNIINSNNLVANLRKNANGEMEVYELFLKDNVKIVTPTDTITSNKGYYNVNNEYAQAEGNVVISRSNSVITGDKSEINLKTGIAKMISNKKDRVKAIFVSEDK